VRDRAAAAGAAPWLLPSRLPVGREAGALFSEGPDRDLYAYAEARTTEQLGEEIATLARKIHVATHRMLVLLARFDAHEGWKATGHRGGAEWLAWRTGMDLHTAREHVRVARSLRQLPETSASMAKGKLSFSKVRALTRVAEPESEAELLEVAEQCSAARLERVVRSWKAENREDEAARAERLHRSRRLSVFPGEDGMYAVQGRMEPEVGALLMRAIEAASDALYREERGREALGSGRSDFERSLSRRSETPGGRSGELGRRAPVRDARAEAARRRADALGLLAERALAAGFGGGSPRQGSDPAAESGEEVSSDACENAAAGEVDSGGVEAVLGADSGSGAAADSGGQTTEVSAIPAPLSGTRAERYQVLLHVDADTLSADREPGRSELEDGTRVPAETSRRLACDAAVVRVEHGPHGRVLDVGRRTRSIPPALRRALEVRDRGCRFPGCGLRFTEGHHVEHWADGGATSLDNCLLLCRHHHRLVHEGGWKIEWRGAGRAVFVDPRGRRHGDEPPEEEIRQRRRKLWTQRGDQIAFRVLD